MKGAPRRLERGVYVRQVDGRPEYGSRCDELTGATSWTWGFATQAQARRDYQGRRAAVHRARQAGGTLLPTKATIGELRDEYLASIEGKRLSFADKRRHLDWWATYFQAQPVLTIRSVQIEAGLSRLVKQGRSPSTANRYAESFRRMLRKLVVPHEWVVELWQRIELFDEPESVPVPLTDEEEDRLYASLELQDALYVRLAVLLGIRLSQFFTQRWEALSWEHAILHLPRFKRHKARLLPVPQEAMAIYALLWEQQGRPAEGWVFPVRKQTFIGAGPGRWIAGPVLVQTEQHMNPHNWYARKYRPAVVHAQLRAGVNFHTLRKTWASRLGAHTPARILQILGGWSSVELVQRYSLPFAHAMREAMERGAERGSVEKVSRPSLLPSGKLMQLLEDKAKRPRSSVG